MYHKCNSERRCINAKRKGEEPYVNTMEVLVVHDLSFVDLDLTVCSSLVYIKIVAMKLKLWASLTTAQKLPEL